MANLCNKSLLVNMLHCLATGLAVVLVSMGWPAAAAEPPAAPSAEPLPEMLAPADGQAVPDPLTAELRWRYYYRASHTTYWPLNLKVSPNADLSAPIVDLDLPDQVTSYRLAISPETTYTWQLMPFEKTPQGKVEFPERAVRRTFRGGTPRNDFSAPDAERYRNPRVGAHWQYMDFVDFAEHEPLSPWYELKAYRDSQPPTLEAIRDRIPAPLWNGHPEALEAYWYCFDAALRVWSYAPEAPDHQAVANLIGYRNWGEWGVTMVWDTITMLHFARYGAYGYPFISGMDNVYARQHENGFISRESDRANREVYVIFPVNPNLYAWCEWEWYQVTGDLARLRRVFLPIVKQYEWYLRYQRRENGLYWVVGHNEADDSPRNVLMHASVSATCYQGIASRYLARIAAEIGRDDMIPFFDAQNATLRTLVNEHFWDEEHQLYNDLTKDGRFITELEPGKLCKHVHMFWPMMAGFVPPERLGGMLRELRDPNAFARSSGVPSLSADSAGYNTENDGHYWRGAIWPPTQLMVQEGLKTVGEWDLLGEIACRYHRACVTAWQQDRTMRESIAPDRPVTVGAPDFVGWSGVGPVANLIEHVLGFEVDVPRRTITWRVRQLERHGIERLPFGDGTVSLVCEARADADQPAQLTVTSDVPLTLICFTGAGPGAQPKEIAIEPGTRQFQAP